MLLHRRGPQVHAGRQLCRQDGGHLRLGQRGHLRLRKGHPAGRQGGHHERLQRLRLRPQRHRPGLRQGPEGGPPRPHQGVRRDPPLRYLRGRLPPHLGDPLRHRAALRHPERDRQGLGRDPGQERLHRRVRGRQHAQHPRGHPGLPGQRRAVWPRQGHQRRRRGHLRPGDEPEQRAPELDL